METGALLIADALGFRGFWELHGEKDILKKMVRLQRQTKAAIDESTTRAGEVVERFPKRDREWLSQLPLPVVLEAVFLSDTVCVGVANKNSIDRSVFVAISIAAHLAIESCKMPAPFTYRGCISHGPFTLQDPFILGPAVDEAAGGERIADGPFIWLTSSASASLQRFMEQRKPFLAIHPEWHYLRKTVRTFRYEMPCHGDPVTMNVDVVNPLAKLQNSRARDSWKRAALATFVGASPDVVAKKGNFQRFLKACERDIELAEQE